MQDNPRPIGPDHINFARALVRLAREHGSRSLTATFQLSGSSRFRDGADNWSRVELSWAEHRHGAAGRISLRAQADESFDEFLFKPEDCPGHVIASADPTVCSKCGASLSQPAADPDDPAPTYDYVRRQYGVNPVVGQRVRHNELTNLAEGTIAPENPSQAHYVMVKFPELYDGEAVPCHPTALDYLDQVR